MDRPVKIGIDAEGFNSWGGGIDFIATLAEAIEATGRAETYLLYPTDSAGQIMFKSVKCLKNSVTAKQSFKKLLDGELTDNKGLIDGFRVSSPKTKLIPYKRSENRLKTDIEKRKQRCVQRQDLDIVLPSVHCRDKGFPVPQIGYLYDFQHRYLKEFFDAETIKNRDLEFERQLKASKYILVNSQACKNDISKFFPDAGCEVIALPFAPFLRPDTEESADLGKYGLPEHYYMISNQFWEHKNHLRAFLALEAVYARGITDLHIVCTGKMQDDKNPMYVKGLMEEIGRLKCKDNIHLLGYIPKTDQIAIMKGSTGVIQPTLFEGGPGGGMVYNALCLGVCCLVSDIPVNREIEGYDTVFFFDPSDTAGLADLMIGHRSDRHEDDAALDKRIADNKLIIGNCLMDNITRILETEEQK